MSTIGKIISCGRAIFIFDLYRANSIKEAESMVRISEPKVGQGDLWNGRSQARANSIAEKIRKNTFMYNYLAILYNYINVNIA